VLNYKLPTTNKGSTHHPNYRVNPDILSPVRDSLSGKGRGSPNHTHI